MEQSLNIVFLIFCLQELQPDWICEVEFFFI
jgi:hypothetical protein